MRRRDGVGEKRCYEAGTIVVYFERDLRVAADELSQLGSGGGDGSNEVGLSPQDGGGS